MKIKNSEIWPVTMPFEEPYTIAYETIDSATNIFLRITTNTGLSGLGRFGMKSLAIWIVNSRNPPIATGYDRLNRCISNCPVSGHDLGRQKAFLALHQPNG